MERAPARRPMLMVVELPLLPHGLVPSSMVIYGTAMEMEMDMLMMNAIVEAAARVEDDIYGASLASSVDGLHPMALDEPNPFPISYLRAKYLAGPNMEEINEESYLER